MASLAGAIVFGLDTIHQLWENVFAADLAHHRIVARYPLSRIRRNQYPNPVLIAR